MGEFVLCELNINKSVKNLQATAWVQILVQFAYQQWDLEQIDNVSLSIFPFIKRA